MTAARECHPVITPVGKGGGWYDVHCDGHRWQRRVQGFTAALSEKNFHEAERRPFPPPPKSIAEVLGQVADPAESCPSDGAP